MVAPISAVAPGAWYSFWFTIFPSRDSSKGFLLVFPTVPALAPQVKEPKWEFHQVLHLSVSTMHSGSGEIIPDGFRDPLWGGSELKCHWVPDPMSPYSGGPQCHPESPGISVHSEQVSNTSLKVWLFPFPQSMVSLVKGHKSFQKRRGERLTVYIFRSILSSFLKRTQPTLHSKGSEPVNLLKSGWDGLGGYDFLFLWFKLDFCSLDLEFFCLWK